MANLKNTNINDNLELPQGTTAQRPSTPQEGQIRYNTDLETVEFYNGTNWWPLSDTHPEATGGTVVDTDIGGVPYRYHYFRNVGNSTFTVSKSGEIDVFLVGGGAGGSTGRSGGGGGYTNTVKGIFVSAGNYTISVGAGGAINGVGGTSSAFGVNAAGGNGMNGGSGGGAGTGGSGCGSRVPGRGGSNGQDAGLSSDGIAGGSGQGFTTAEFGEPGSTIYAGGGAGSTCSAAQIVLGSESGGGASNTLPNSANAESGVDGLGGGGGGADGSRAYVPGTGGLGIVIVRYKKNSSDTSQADEIKPSFQPFNYARDVRNIIVRDGLILDLDAANPLSYSGIGTTWADLSGNSNDGTLINGTRYNTRTFGRLTFDGVNDAVTVPHDDIFNLTSQVTVFAVINQVDNSGVSNFQRITDKGGRLTCWLNHNDKKIYIRIGASPNNFVLDYTFDQSRIYHVAWTYNKDATDDRTKLYVNGILEATSNDYSGDMGVNTSALVIGNWAAGTRPWTGEISSIQIYNRALPLPEIQQNFNAVRRRYGI